MATGNFEELSFLDGGVLEYSNRNQVFFFKCICFDVWGLYICYKTKKLTKTVIPMLYFKIQVIYFYFYYLLSFYSWTDFPLTSLISLKHWLIWLNYLLGCLERDGGCKGHEGLWSGRRVLFLYWGCGYTDT